MVLLILVLTLKKRRTHELMDVKLFLQSKNTQKKLIKYRKLYKKSFTFNIMKDQSPIKFLMIRFAKQDSGLQDEPTSGFNS